LGRARLDWWCGDGRFWFELILIWIDGCNYGDFVLIG
jgi:hypothetical protein